MQSNGRCQGRAKQTAWGSCESKESEEGGEETRKTVAVPALWWWGMWTRGLPRESTFWGVLTMCLVSLLKGVFSAVKPALKTPSGEAAKKSLGELLCFAKLLTPAQRRGKTKLSS